MTAKKSSSLPRWREDIEVGEPDLAEEVIREYGYEHIVPTFLKAATVTTGGLTAEQKAQAKTKRTMCAQGFYEAETLAFYADADLDMLHIAADAPERKVIRILNPISSHLTIMRPLLAPSLLNVVVDNLRKGNAEGRLFEMSNIYIPKLSTAPLTAKKSSSLPQAAKPRCRRSSGSSVTGSCFGM